MYSFSDPHPHPLRSRYGRRASSQPHPLIPFSWEEDLITPPPPHPLLTGGGPHHSPTPHHHLIPQLTFVEDRVAIDPLHNKAGIVLIKD